MASALSTAPTKFRAFASLGHIALCLGFLGLGRDLSLLGFLLILGLLYALLDFTVKAFTSNSS